MPTIVALNPSKKKKRKNAGSRLAKKSKGSKMAKAIVKAKPKRRRRNPSNVKVITRYARNTVGGVNMMGAVKSTVPLLFGALVAKFAAKKFAEGGAESDNWSYKNYLLALAGGFVVAFGTSALLKKRAAAQKVFEGALLLIGYKIFTGEIAPKNPGLESWFGAADDFDPYQGTSVGDTGDIWQGGNEDYIKGYDGQWRPVSEAHRQPAYDMGDVLVTPDSRYGDVLITPDPRYGNTPASSDAARIAEKDGM